MYQCGVSFTLKCLLLCLIPSLLGIQDRHLNWECNSLLPTPEPFKYRWLILFHSLGPEGNAHIFNILVNKNSCILKFDSPEGRLSVFFPFLCLPMFIVSLSVDDGISSFSRVMKDRVSFFTFHCMWEVQYCQIRLS